MTDIDRLSRLFQLSAIALARNGLVFAGWKGFPDGVEGIANESDGPWIRMA